MVNAADWRTEPRTVYSIEFILRIVEIALHPDDSMAKSPVKMELLTISYLSCCKCGESKPPIIDVWCNLPAR